MDNILISQFFPTRLNYISVFLKGFFITEILSVTSETSKPEKNYLTGLLPECFS